MNTSKNRLCVFDIETYANFFSATFKDYNTKEVKQFVIYKNRNDIEELLKFIDNPNLWLAGYNNSHFDNQLLKYMMENKFMYYDESPNDIANHIYKFAKTVIEDDWREHMYQLPFKSLDLMKIGNLNQKSLKLTGTVFKWHKLQDLPYAWDHVIQDDEVDVILKYNLNDVEITERLMELLEPQVKLRFNISNQYNINAYSQTDSGIANKLLEKFYSEATGIPVQQFRTWRTKRPRIGFWDVIFQDVYFKTKELRDFSEDLRQTVFYPAYPFTKKPVVFDGMKYVTGVGGIHASREGTIYRADENTKVIDYDFDSYYPNLIVNNNIHPQHLGSEFIIKYKELMNQRIEAKKKSKDKRRSQESRNKYKTEADTLKITINSSFGKLGFEHHWLYDPLAMLKVTVNGQMYLLMLAEQLTINGFEVIAVNTDGLVTIVPNNMEDDYKRICKQFSDFVNIGGEFTYYDLYAQADVNNYLAIDTEGNVKTKGLFNVPDVT